MLIDLIRTITIFYSWKLFNFKPIDQNGNCIELSKMEKMFPEAHKKLAHSLSYRHLFNLKLEKKKFYDCYFFNEDGDYNFEALNPKMQERNLKRFDREVCFYYFLSNTPNFVSVQLLLDGNEVDFLDLTKILHRSSNNSDVTFTTTSAIKKLIFGCKLLKFDNDVV